MTTRMIPACDSGPTHPKLAQWLPDLRCDREAGHNGPHRMRRRPGHDDWWLGACIGVEEGLVTSMLADAAKEQAKADREAARAAKRKAKASGELFAATKEQP